MFGFVSERGSFCLAFDVFLCQQHRLESTLHSGFPLYRKIGALGSKRFVRMNGE